MSRKSLSAGIIFLSTVMLARVPVLGNANKQAPSPNRAENHCDGNCLTGESWAGEGRVRGVVPIASVKIVDSKTVHAASPLLPVVDQEDIAPDDRLLLDGILRWMTPLCRENLRNIVIRKNPDAERGQASAHTVLLRGGMPKSETTAVLIHECGHVVDLGAYDGSENAGSSAYPDGALPTWNDDPSVLFYQISWQNSTKPRQDAAKSDFVSGYAMTDPWEDLAESVVYYALHEAAFRERATDNPSLAAKLQWVETNVFGPDFMTSPSATWDGKIPWDVTKLPHGL